MNHKRRRPKSSRAGCLMCKPHKHQGTSCLRSAKIGDRRKMQDKKLSGGELREHWEID